MPHLRMRAVSAETVKSLSATLPEPLASAMQTSTDNFTFELIGTQFFANGKADPAYPIVEVLWFERSEEVKQASADIITEKVRVASGLTDVMVIFTPIKKTDYFENGKHF